MRFFHIADVHLGAEPEKGHSWEFKRKEEIWDTFRRVIQQAKAKQIDFFFIAGDLFHRQPFLRELKEVSYLFSSLAPTQVVFIAGNHDYLTKDSYYLKIKWPWNVHMFKSTGIGKLYFKSFGVSIYGGSYGEREDKRYLYDKIHPENLNCINILLVHGGDKLHRPYRPEILAHSGFDYVACGHIHKPTIEVSNKVAQAGALEPLDASERGAHGYIEGEVTKESCHICFVPFAKREYFQIPILVNTKDTIYSVEEQIYAKMQERGMKHIYSFFLEGMRDSAIRFPLEDYQKIGNICKIMDQTYPDYDLEKLYRENKSNVLGYYIRSFFFKKEEARTQDLRLSTVEEKALEYGILALIFGE